MSFKNLLKNIFVSYQLFLKYSRFIFKNMNCCKSNILRNDIPTDM